MAYRYEICGWSGRLGNHLLQLSHGIYLAEKYNGVCFLVQEEPYIQNKTFDFSNGNPITKVFDESFWELNSRYSPTMEDYAEDLHQERPRILRDYVLPIFKPYQQIELNYDMVINIRGGDIFTGLGSPPQYVQAPLSYFLSILEKENPNKVLLVCEDRINPVVNALEKTNYNIDIRSEDDVELDANHVLNSKVLVIGGISTFSLLLAQMSPHTKRVYYPNFDYGWNLPEDELWRKDHWYREENLLGNMKADVIPVKFLDYIKIGEWGDFTIEEKTDLMLTHPINKIYY
jgi:hypothetical protein